MLVDKPGSRIWLGFLCLSTLIGASLACSRSLQTAEDAIWKVPSTGGSVFEPTNTAFVFLPPTRIPGAPILTPTPDAPHQIPSIRVEPETYSVQAGDTLGQIADAFGLSVEEIVRTNKLVSADVLEIGQVLDIPVPTPEERGSGFKLIPDSEHVYGPFSAYFDLDGFVKNHGGYLAQYREKINEEKLTGAEIVLRVSQNYSVNPRLLLAVLEYQSQWLTQKNPDKATQVYPIGWRDPNRKDLYRQLAWAANNLNRGYYLWKVNGVASWILADGRVVPVDPMINAGTAGIQHLFSQLFGYKEWEKAVSEDGLFAVYNELFGYPFDLALEPLIPADLVQPLLQLPFEKGVGWLYTGGPHAGWDSGSAWAGLDFAPDNEPLGCVPSDEWVVAVGDGLVIRTGEGIVIQDLHDPNGLPGDGLEQTGWVILYMHIAEKDRVSAGTYLKAGDRIGHPSCEGGIASGTHVHLARRYNGEWIPADQNLPFVLDGWISVGDGLEYEGLLERDSKKIRADAEQTAKNNKISR